MGPQANKDWGSRQQKRRSLSPKGFNSTPSALKSLSSVLPTSTHHFLPDQGSPKGNISWCFDAQSPGKDAVWGPRLQTRPPHQLLAERTLPPHTAPCCRKGQGPKVGVRQDHRPYSKGCSQNLWLRKIGAGTPFCHCPLTSSLLQVPPSYPFPKD